MDIEDVLRDAEQPERVVELCLKGKLAAQHEELSRQLTEAQRDDALETRKMADASRSKEIAAQVRELEEQMKAASVAFRVRGVSYFEREDWLKANPPRDGEDEKFNPVTAVPDLIARCLIEPAASAEQVKRLIEKIGTGQTDRLFGTCLNATYDGGAVPFSAAASVSLGGTATSSR